MGEGRFEPKFKIKNSLSDTKKIIEKAFHEPK